MRTYTRRSLRVPRRDSKPYAPARATDSWPAVIGPLYPIWSAAVVVVFGGMAQAVATAVGWTQAASTRDIRAPP